MLHLGKGGIDAVKMATLLGIPLSADWGNNTFPHVARQFGKNAETLALHACDVNLAKEIDMALEAGAGQEPVGGVGKRSEKKESAFKSSLLPLHNQLNSPWGLCAAVTTAATDTDLAANEFGWCVRIPISIDMGWAKRSSGRRYDSRTGLETAIGGRSGQLLDYVVMAKDCWACNAVRRKGAMPTEEMKAQHDCRENHFGKSSKSMESSAAVILQHRLHKRFVTTCPSTKNVLSAVMDPVVSDDDAASRAQLRPIDPSGIDAVARGPTWIGKIATLCDPGHRIKCFTSPLYASNTNKKTIAYTKKTLAYALKQGNMDDLQTMKKRLACAKNHMCGNHSDCDAFFPGHCHALHQEDGMEHQPALPYKKYFTDGLPSAVESSWAKVTTDAMLHQCLHAYNTQKNEACNNSFTNCEQPKSRCQYAGTPIHNFRAAAFAIRQTIGFRGLLYALQQSGAHIVDQQFVMADTIEKRTDYRKSWSASKQGKARR